MERKKVNTWTDTGYLSLKIIVFIRFDFKQRMTWI